MKNPVCDRCNGTNTNTLCGLCLAAVRGGEELHSKPAQQSLSFKPPRLPEFVTRRNPAA